MWSNISLHQFHFCDSKKVEQTLPGHVHFPSCKLPSHNFCPSFHRISHLFLVNLPWFCHTVTVLFICYNLAIESYDQPRKHIKKQRHCSANKGLSGQGYGFSSGHVWMWELDCEESGMPKNWCFLTVVLDKTLESPLDCKEIPPVHPKGDQSWVFIGGTDAEAETPILWTPHLKSWLIGKDPDAERDWGQEEKGATEDEMAGWHHRLDGHEFE